MQTTNSYESSSIWSRPGVDRILVSLSARVSEHLNRASEHAGATLVAAFALFVALAGLFQMPPIDRDEARFVQATAQMLETGDFVTIKFQDQERNKKPVGIHWLQAASVATVSNVEARAVWAYRLPSLLGVVLAAVFTSLIGRRLFGARAGLLAGALLAAAPITAAEATFAKTDAMLLATVAGAFLALSLILEARYGARVPKAGTRRTSWIAALGLWTAVGAGVLIKGPIIVLVLATTLITIAIVKKDIGLIGAVRPITGLAVVAAMVAPWALAINAATDGRFFADAVGGDLLGKVGAVQERHGGPPGYHLLLVWALLWPATPLLFEAARKTIRERQDWRALYLIAWAAPAWLVFELTATKLPHYTLPLYPALALAVGAYAARETNGSEPTIFQKAGIVVFAAIGLAMAGGMIALPALNGGGAFALTGYAVIATVFFGGVLFAALAYYRGLNQLGAISAVVCSAVFAWVYLSAALPGLAPLRLSTDVAVVVKSEAGGSAILSGYYEPSAVFLLHGDAILAKGAAAARQVAKAVPGDRLVLSRAEKPAFDAAAEEIEFNRTLKAVTTLKGVNYSNGDALILDVYVIE
ncbi:MAG: glycosyltransferase family 39 protein [Pseudomonadota bacterium]